MGCRGDFDRKMKKTVWGGGQFDPPPGKGGVKKRCPLYSLREKIPHNFIEISFSMLEDSWDTKNITQVEEIANRNTTSH